MSIIKSRSFIYILIISLITFIIYSSGLLGDYVFDDMPNIVDNEKLKIENLNKNEILTAFWSGDAGPLGRPISMLSFGLNYYFTGLDPYYFKLTNLLIHLANSILVYFIAYKILQRILIEKNRKHIIYGLAAIVSIVWAVHPLNLTSVLYVVQRMTSLSAFFGFFAILLYCHWRTLYSIKSLASFSMIFGIVFCLICSAYSKESGMLFIPLIYWIELFIFKGKNYDYKDIYIFKINIRKYLYAGLFIGLLIYVCIGVKFLNNDQYGNRDFSSLERLLSETRVIFYYLKLIFYPLLSDLSLYHDNFVVSKNLVTPITTLYSFIAFILISGFSLILSKSRPLILFAWGWFVISHLIESSFIPLELVHEHRNYFSFIGFIIVIVYYLEAIENKKVRPFIYILAIIFISNLAFTTWQRSMIWSNLVDHAAYEATMKPDSDRANYQLARIYMKLMDKNPEQKQYYADLALQHLRLAQTSYLAGNAAYFGEIHLNSYLNKPTEKYVIDQLIKNLKHNPFYNSNINFISNFMQCQVNGKCNIPHDQAIAIIVAGLENKGISVGLKAAIYNTLAQYFVGAAGDFIKGEEFAKEAISYEKRIDSYLLLTQIYRLQGKLNEAKEQINIAIQLDHNNIWWKEIAIEQRKIAEASS